MPRKCNAVHSNGAACGETAASPELWGNHRTMWVVVWLCKEHHELSVREMPGSSREAHSLEVITPDAQS